MELFRTIEISEPQFENSCLRYITVKSRHLKGRGDICVFVPPFLETVKDCPLIILLHGVYGSSWSWTLNGGVHITALEMMQQKKIPPAVIAMPSDGLWGDGSGYIPHDGLDFEKWIAEDVPAAVQKCIPSVRTSSRLFIGGLSMGGFGALKIGTRYAGQFSAVAAHSSLTHLAQMELFVEEEVNGLLQKEAKDNSVFLTIMKHKHQLPFIRFDCGLLDTLLDENRLLHHQLLEAGIPHEYEEREGGHEWPYWQKHIRDSLLFFSKYF
ncbi:esterase family protein [Sphingobacterium sp. SGG-5]|uniref:alpha/beta hydrolase n=1 Tax=Sphingobacterium sp. SGG-5 TaxID=2710881 RepID=UPI0013EA8218|nr:alpha/beta hydrolase-fold protein [Sphingobacterium sp. SGG-5]NGM61095.1 esterase family protein [Sphingobacterium sp. SGG-5]